MFERYTERARRVIFFARYEASQFGSVAIEPEHLLLGVLREDRNAISRFLGPKAPAEDIRNEIASRLAIKEKVSTSVDLPLTPASKRILAHSAEEVERLGHHHIGVEHLLLGILREEGTVAAQVLDARGLKLNSAREELARNPLPEEPSGFAPRLEELSNFYGALRNPALPKSGVISDGETARKVAEAIWTTLYGEQTVAAQKPLQAELKFNTWIVTGSAAPESALFAFILQADGRILSIGLGRPKP
jgi:Clp amino terminal domain, pathogenicity island component/NTF2 fold immunity protein